MRSASRPLVALALVLAGCASAPQSPLDKLNGDFRGIYARARTMSLSQGEPYLIVTFDSVILHAAGKVTSEPYTPPLYAQYKKVAHAILTTFCLARICSDPLGEQDLALVQDYLKDLDAARDHLAEAGFPQPVLERQRHILDQARQYLASVLQVRRVDAKARDAALQALEPDVMENVAAAARVQLDDLNRAVTLLTRGLDAPQRRALHVVVTGTHQARDRYLQMAYFRKALGEAQPVEDRLVFCELEFSQGPRIEDRAEQLLGTHLLDEAAALAIFTDRSRLQDDILGEEADRHVRTMNVPALR